MKTKTGKLLMMQIKAKSNQSVPIDRENSDTNNTEHYTPAKPQLSSQSLKQNFGEHEVHRQQQYQNSQYEVQLNSLRHQNTILRQQIQALKNQLYTINIKPQTSTQQTQTLQDPHQPSNQMQQSKKKYMINSQQKPKPQLKLKQKCSALQVQNYRLIQNNYMLLLSMKKNLRVYKDSLSDILSKLQSLQFAEAAEDVYKMLNNLKNEELTSNEFQTSLFPNNKPQPMTEKPQKVPIESIKPLKFVKLSINSLVYEVSHFQQRKIQQKQNQIQIKLTKIPHLPITNQIPYSSRQSSSFHLINSRHPDPQFSHYSNNKLFNSQIRDLDYHVSGLDKVSLQDKVESDWDHSARKQPTVYKCHGNTTDLYRMLMLQALAIEGFVG